MPFPRRIPRKRRTRKNFANKKIFILLVAFSLYLILDRYNKKKDNTVTDQLLSFVSTPKAPTSSSNEERAEDGHEYFVISHTDPNPVLTKAFEQSIQKSWQRKSFQEQIQDSKFSCDWTTFNSTTGKTTEFCTHPFRDIVSARIRNKHRWYDCDALPKLWNEKSIDENSLYLEIGANIGSCVVEMLLSTNANIIAFEPHPMNQFNLMSTLSRMPEEYQKRLVLFPIGLGDQTMKSRIYSGHNNLGNSNIGTFVKDAESQVAKEEFQFDVYVKRLNDVLDLDNVNVPLLKLDSQGFECKILEGMGKNIAGKIDSIKFEFAKKWLDGQKCEDLLPRLRKYGFQVTRENGKEVLEDNPNYHLAEMLARKPIRNVDGSQI